MPDFERATITEWRRADNRVRPDAPVCVNCGTRTWLPQKPGVPRFCNAPDCRRARIRWCYHHHAAYRAANLAFVRRRRQDPVYREWERRYKRDRTVRLADVRRKLEEQERRGG